MVRGCNMYSYFAYTILLALVYSRTAQPQETTSTGVVSSLTTISDSTTVTTVQPVVTSTTGSDLTTLVPPTPAFTDENITTALLTTAVTDVTVATTDATVTTESPNLSATGVTVPTVEGTTQTEVTTDSGSGESLITTNEATTDAVTITVADLGSGTTDESTTTSITSLPESGSGSETTTVQEGGGFTTTNSFIDSSGSGATDVTTIASSETTFTSFEVSRDVTTTESNNATTVFEVSTGFNTTSFVVSTAEVGVESDAEFPWYLIVIICLSVIILLLIIIFVVVYCKSKQQPGSALLKKATPVSAADNVAETSPKALISNDSNQPRPKPVPDRTILPPESVEEPRMNFVSTSPMNAPLYVLDPSSSVRKRDKARGRSRRRESSFDDDEGFNEPLMTRDEQPSRGTAKRRKPPIRNVQDVPTVEPTERTITYQPYFLPTPIQTALTGKGLGDQLTDDAMAEREYLQRSDIERHQMKQRLRMQKRSQQNDSFRDRQRSIDAVLQPMPPKPLQGVEERRRLQKHGLIDDERKPRRSSRRKPSRHDSVKSGTSEDSTASEEKHAAHEKVIAKMTKLLEDAYALLAPAIQKTLVTPLNSEPQGAVAPYNQLPSTSNLQPPHDERLFTRTNTPPALLPQSGLYGHSNPSYLPGNIPQKSNDSQSPIWTPYRTFDRLQDLQKQDTSLSPVPNTRPPNAIHNISMPNAQYPPPSPFSKPSLHRVHDPFAQIPPSPIPGRARPMPRQQQPGSIPMNPIRNHPASIPSSSAAQSGDPNNPTIDQSTNYIDAGVNQPTASIVQSIKDTLAQLSGKGDATDDATQESNC